VIAKAMRRNKLLEFFASLPSCLVGLEASGSAHHWARELIKLGHEARMMPPAYVKPYIRRQKNDAADAAAICEAVMRPSMRFVRVCSLENQAALMRHKTREMLVSQRTQLVNGLRDHLTEVGVIAGQVSGSLAWVMISGEDAPEFLGSAPVTRKAADLYKLGPIALPIALFAQRRNRRRSRRSGSFDCDVELVAARTAKCSLVLRRHSHSRLVALLELVVTLNCTAACAITVMTGWVGLVVLMPAIAVLWSCRPRDRAMKVARSGRREPVKSHAQRRLVCSGLVETHIHLDKAGIVGRCAICTGTLSEAVSETAKAKAAFTEEDVYKRASAVVEKAILHGANRMRTLSRSTRAPAFAPSNPSRGLRPISHGRSTSKFVRLPRRD
jgi:hypothetical protein